MRKTLLFMASVAMMASCTNDLLETEVAKAPAALGEGITFEVVQDETRGVINQNFTSNFFAEKDKIDIWSSNALDNSGTLIPAWSVGKTYKVTSSTGNPRFTAEEDADILNLNPWGEDAYGNNTSKAEFFAAYPTGQAIAYNVGDGKFTVTPNKDLYTQSMEGGYMNFDARLMYAYTTAQRDNNTVLEANKSVGEKAELMLNSPLSVAAFKIEDIDDYKNDLGKLRKIVLASDRNGLVPAVANISGNAGTIEVEYSDLKNVGGVWKFKHNYTTPGGIRTDVIYSAGLDLGQIDETDKFVVNKNGNINLSTSSPRQHVKKANLEIAGGAGEEIKNNQIMSLFVLPTTDHASNNQENYTIRYDFEHGSLVYDVDKDINFIANKPVGFSLNINKRYNYIVVNDQDNPGKNHLIFIKGNVKDAILSDGKVAWTKYETDLTKISTTVEMPTITKVTVLRGVNNLDDTDWDRLNKLTSCKELNIQNGMNELKSVKGMTALEALYADVTSVNAAAFDAGNGTSIKKLLLPNVRTFNTQTSVMSFSNLETLNLEKYDIPTGDNCVLQETFFNNNTKTTLKEVNLKAVTTLAPTFGYQRSILFTGYDKLEKVVLNPIGTKLLAKEFDGCTNLQTIDGVMDISGAEYAFQDCGTASLNPLSAIEINCTVIPDYAFYNSKIKDIKKDGSQVAPTSIGDNAFEDNTAIEKMDLSAATKIGKAAFCNASNFKGNDNGQEIVELNVDCVNSYAFHNTKIKRFLLKKATETKDHSLNSINLLQVQYDAKLTASGGTHKIHVDQIEGIRRANIDIFVYDDEDRDIFRNISNPYHSVNTH